MIDPRNVPELVLIKRRWVLEGAKESSSAWNYEDLAGKHGFLYVVSTGRSSKIGITTNIEKRIRSIHNGTPEPLTGLVVKNVPLAGMAMSEAWLHKKFSGSRLKGEWFSLALEDIRPSMKDAVRVANLYEKFCHDWTMARKEYERRPEVRARNLAEYELFLDAHPEIRERQLAEEARRWLNRKESRMAPVE